MFVGRIIKRLIQLSAGLLLAAMFGYPLLATWLESHPETEQALNGAAEQVDRKAGVFTQGQQFVRGIGKSRELVADEQRERAEDKIDAEQRRKAEENRRFNSGEMAGDSYNSGEMAGDSTNSEY